MAGARRRPVPRPARRDASFKDYVLEQLSGMGELRALGMFGGWGLYCGDVFFGIVSGGRIYFKTDDSSRAGYEALGMQPFRPTPRQTLRRYFEVPPDVLDDPSELQRWAWVAVRSSGGR